MKVSLRWLKDYVDIDIEPRDLADRLTMAGLEVDSVEPFRPSFEGVVTIGSNRRVPSSDPATPGANPLCKSRIVTPIPIDLGRQLFVDDFLIEKTDLKRTYHQAKKFEGNPVFKGGGPGQWDEQIRERGWILKEDGVYHLWYTGYTADDAVGR